MDGIIIFDIDGTVVDSPSQKMPSEKMIKAFECAQSRFILSAATGRPWTFAKDIIQSLTKSPSIVAGGTQIRSYDGEVLWQSSIPPETINKVKEILNTYEDHSLLWNDYEEYRYLDDDGKKTSDMPNDIDYYFLEAIFVPEDIALGLKTDLDNIEGLTATLVVSQRPGLKDLHITNEFATKEHAITELLKITQIDVDKTTGIGDGHNDLHLFAAVKNKVAMGNAVNELKDASDVVIGNVQDDSLADYLTSLL